MEEANNANHSDMGDSGYSRGSGWRLLFASLALKLSQARRSPDFFCSKPRRSSNELQRITNHDDAITTINR
jgi:hypothetical protein